MSKLPRTHTKDFTEFAMAVGQIVGGIGLGAGALALAERLFQSGKTPKEAAKVVKQKREQAKKKKQDAAVDAKWQEQREWLGEHNARAARKETDNPAAKKPAKPKVAAKKPAAKPKPKASGTCKPGQNPKRDGCTSARAKFLEIEMAALNQRIKNLWS